MNERLHAGHPMLSAEFVGGLLRCFTHSGLRPHLACAYDGGVGGRGSGDEAIAGADPQAMLLLVPQAGGLVWRSFLPAQTQIGPSLLPPEVDKPDLTALLHRLSHRALVLELLCVDPKLLDLAAGTLGRLAPPPGRDSAHALTMAIALDGGFEAFWQARSIGLRQNLRRYARRAAGSGREPRLATISDASAIGAAVQRYAELESRGWKAGQGTALALGGAQVAFYEKLLTRAAAAGQARVFELWMGDALVASRLAIAAGGRIVMLKTTYDESQAGMAPGRLLLHAVIEQLFATHPGWRVEFCTNATPDQLAWATESRWVSHWSIHRGTGWAFEARLLRRLRWALRPSRRRSDGPAPVVLRVPKVEDLPADARRLLDSSEARSWQTGADWYTLLQATVYRQAEVQFMVLMQDQAALAVLPTLEEAGADGRVELRALANYYTALFEPALRSGVRDVDLLPLATALRDRRPPSGRYFFSPMDPAGHAYKAWFGALSLAGLVPFSYFSFGNWFVPTPPTWTEYRAGLKSGLRSTLVRLGRRFEESGGRIEIVQDPAALAEALAAYEQVVTRSWKTTEPHPQFLPEMVRVFGARGMLRIGVARLAGQAVAAQIWIVHGRRADIYKVAYDQAHKQLALGSLVTGHLVEHTIERDRVLEIDFQIGDEPYKRDWMRERRERWGIVAYDPRTLAGMISLLRESAGRLWRAWQRRRSLSAGAATDIATQGALPEGR